MKKIWVYDVVGYLSNAELKLKYQVEISEILRSHANVSDKQEMDEEIMYKLWVFFSFRNNIFRKLFEMRKKKEKPITHSHTIIFFLFLT